MKLLILDRDGTIIEDKHFLGKNQDWKNEIILKKNIISVNIYKKHIHD